MVCADGGYEHAVEAGLVADAVVGDLDSYEAMRHQMPEPRVVVEDNDPETTDLQKAVEWAMEKGAHDIDVACAGGGRGDHHLANLSMLTLYRGRASVVLADDLFDVSAVDGTQEIAAEPGTVVSLVALGTCEGVSTTGLRWDLVDERLEFSPRGVHNEVAHSPATVSVRRGDLLLFHGRFIEKHR